MSDLIDRQAVIDVLVVLCQEHRYKIPGKGETYSQYNEAWQDALDRAEGAIFNLPSAEPVRKTGHWKLDWKHDKATCSECGHTFRDAFDIDDFDNFCRHCGADMRGAGRMNNQKHCRGCPHLDFNEMSDEMYCKLKDYEPIRLRWHKQRPDWCPLVIQKGGKMHEAYGTDHRFHHGRR